MSEGFILVACQSFWFLFCKNFWRFQKMWKAKKSDSFSTYLTCRPIIFIGNQLLEFGKQFTLSGWVSKDLSGPASDLLRIDCMNQSVRIYTGLPQVQGCLVQHIQFTKEISGEVNDQTVSLLRKGKWSIYIPSQSIVHADYTPMFELLKRDMVGTASHPAAIVSPSFNQSLQ